MSNQYSVAKGDIFLQSKHADESYEHNNNNDWILFFYNTPKKGKALIVEYSPEDWPAVCISIRANWKAKIVAKKYSKDPHARAMKL